MLFVTGCHPTGGHPLGEKPGVPASREARLTPRRTDHIIIKKENFQALPEKVLQI